MARVNCWQVKKCGREEGGIRTAELGVCPAALERKANGLNGGRNGGRVCWALAGTLCGGTVQGSFATKLANCMQCDFYRLVSREERVGLLTGAEVLATLNRP